jgi:hypothetical protein
MLPIKRIEKKVLLVSGCTNTGSHISYGVCGTDENMKTGNYGKDL